MKKRVLRVIANAIAAVAPKQWARAVAWSKECADTKGASK